MRAVIRDYQKNLFSGLLKKVILPGEDGEMAILDFHQTIVTRLKQGEMVMQLDDLSWRVLEIKAGIAKFHHNELVVLIF